MHAEERALDRRLLLVERPAAVLARHDDPELAHHPEMIRIAVGERVEVHVSRVNAGIERALGQLDLGRNVRDRPSPPRVLGVHHGAEVAHAVAALAGREGEREEVPRRAGRCRRPGCAAVRRTVDAALLARDPCGAGVDAGDGEEGALGARILPLPGGAAVRGVEDAAELAHHPAVPVGREAGAEEPLPHFTERDRRGSRLRREEHEREPDLARRRHCGL